MTQKLSNEEMLVTIATMAIIDDNLTPHDIIEALKEGGHHAAITEARKIVETSYKRK